MAGLGKPEPVPAPSMTTIISQLGDIRDTLEKSVQDTAKAAGTTHELGARVASMGVRDTAAALADLRDRVDMLSAHVTAGRRLAADLITRAQFISTGTRNRGGGSAP
jgi:hypothetical protein